MFTGLIEDVGNVAGIERRGSSARLLVETAIPLAEIDLGDSISVNGVCLTVSEKGNGVAVFDVSPETVERTTLKSLKYGSKVNLERALRLSDRIGGHLVTGHVDFSATISDRREVAGNIIFTCHIPSRFARFIVEKGSVAVDGISLTVNTITSDDHFSVNIIPHTAIKTTLPGRRRGDEVNIETDIIGKYLERLVSGKLKGDSGGITLDLLAKNGFL